MTECCECMLHMFQYGCVFITLMLVVAALDGVYGGDGGVHPRSGTAGAQRQPGDDAGLQTFYSGK